MNQPGPQLTAQCKQSDTALRVLWSVVNSTAEHLYVCVRANIGNRLLNEPYTYLGPADAMLTATFRWMPIPPGVEVHAVDLPFYRLLGPGQVTENAFELAAPIREIHPYASPTYPEKPISTAVSSLAFSAEYFWAHDALFARETRHDPELVQAKSLHPLFLEKLLPLERPATVLRRTDDYFRYSSAELAPSPRPEKGLSQRRP